MTDRELLELAARAAGMGIGRAQDGQWFYCEHGQCGEGMYRIDGNLLEFWNARTDDGDALRLAVKLFLTVDSCHTYAQASTPDGAIVEVFADEVDNQYSATRRAIVRAAAEIGKAMNGSEK